MPKARLCPENRPLQIQTSSRFMLFQLLALTTLLRLIPLRRTQSRSTRLRLREWRAKLDTEEALRHGRIRVRPVECERQRGRIGDEGAAPLRKIGRNFHRVIRPALTPDAETKLSSGEGSIADAGCRERIDYEGKTLRGAQAGRTIVENFQCEVVRRVCLRDERTE